MLDIIGFIGYSIGMFCLGGAFTILYLRGRK